MGWGARHAARCGHRVSLLLTGSGWTHSHSLSHGVALWVSRRVWEGLVRRHGPHHTTLVHWRTYHWHLTSDHLPHLLLLLPLDHHALLHLRRHPRLLSQHAWLLRTPCSWFPHSSEMHLLSFHAWRPLPHLLDLARGHLRPHLTWLSLGRHPHHLALLQLALGDHCLNMLDLLVWGKITELRVLSNDSLDVDGHADLACGNPWSLGHHARLLCSHHAHHCLLFLLLRHQGLLLWTRMTHHSRLGLHLTTCVVVAHYILQLAHPFMLQRAGILRLLWDIRNIHLLPLLLDRDQSRLWLHLRRHASLVVHRQTWLLLSIWWLILNRISRILLLLLLCQFNVLFSSRALLSHWTGSRRAAMLCWGSGSLAKDRLLLEAWVLCVLLEDLLQTL